MISSRYRHDIDTISHLHRYHSVPCIVILYCIYCQYRHDIDYDIDTLYLAYQILCNLICTLHFIGYTPYNWYSTCRYRSKTPTTLSPKPQYQRKTVDIHVDIEAGIQIPTSLKTCLYRWYRRETVDIDVDIDALSPNSISKMLSISTWNCPYRRRYWRLNSYHCL